MVRLRVDDVFKGDVPAEVELSDDGMCDGPLFKQGRQYLMYTRRFPNGVIPARGCTRSRAIEDAEEDLEFWKAYLAGNTKPEIRGEVRRLVQGGEGEAIRDVTVIASSGGRRFQTTTDASGAFSISEIPPGTYEVRAELAAHQAHGRRSKVDLADRGCAVADFFMTVDRRVHGVVRAQDGRPVDGAVVKLIRRRHNPDADFPPWFVDHSDGQGRYEIRGIEPGEYLLAVNVGRLPAGKRPFLPVYYPGVLKADQAVPVIFTTAVSVQSYDLTLPFEARLKVVRVRGRLVLRNGDAASGASRLSVESPDWPDAIREDIDVEADGRFEIDLCEGVNYSLYASIYQDGRKWDAEPVVINAREDGPEIRIVLSPAKQPAP